MVKVFAAPRTINEEAGSTMKFKTTLLALGLAALAAWPARADVTIQEIQLGFYDVNTVVQIDGVVVTAVGRFGFFVQEPDLHPQYQREWSGIWVFTNDLPTVNKGDLVNVVGTYQEYFDFSEIDVTIDGSSYTAVGQAVIPDPVPLAITEVNDTGVLAENYESVLIRVDRTDNTLYADSLNNNGEWYLRTNLTQPYDSLLMETYSASPSGDFLYDVPEAGTEISFAQGILTYSYEQYKLAPRNCDTDLGVSCKPSLRGAYSTGITTVNVQFGSSVEEASAEDISNYLLVSGRSVLTAERSEDNHKFVYLTVTSQPPGQPETIVVSGVRSEDGTQTMDPFQTADFRSGLTPIRQIQFVSNPASDDVSPLFGEVVTIQGRVTAIDGNYVYLQDDDGGAWDGIYSRVARSIPVQERSILQVSGEVTEFNGSTQLRYRAGVDNFRQIGISSTPPTVNTVVASQIPYSSQNRLPEPYENCLVRLTNATVLDSIDGTPGPYYGEWLLRQQAIPDTAGCDLDFITSISTEMCRGNVVDMTGILRYSYFEYRIAPRTGNDIVYRSFGEGCPTTGVDPAGLAAGRVTLQQNQPNPFAPQTRIAFDLARPGRVQLEVMDVAGRLVRVLENRVLPAGGHIATWDGRDAHGHSVAAGTYFYRLRSEGQELSRKMIRLD